MYLKERRKAMALSDMIPKGNLWTGIALGAGLLVAPVVIPAIAGAARPLLKAVIKGGYMVFEQGRETVAEIYEMVEDIVEEAKAEVEADLNEAKDASLVEA
jgi:hypothetical protein